MEKFNNFAESTESVGPGSISRMPEGLTERRVGEVEEVMQRIYQILPDLENSALSLEDRLNTALSPSKDINSKNAGNPAHPVPLVQGLTEIYNRIATVHVALRELHSRIEL